MKRTRLTAVLAVVALMASLGWAPGAAATPDGARDVVVTAGSAGQAAAQVERLGGIVDRELELVGGVAATVSHDAAERLERLPGVTVVADEPVEFQSAGATSTAQDGALRDQLSLMNPPEWWDEQAGSGVGVALVDTGVAERSGLEGRVVHGPDYTDEGDGLDRYGHGTFMAGLIAGDDPGTGEGPTGLAPGAHVVSVKVAGEDGATTLSTVLDAIGWVVTKQDEYGIQVMNLSIGVRTNAAPQSDPLVAAVHAAWSSGLTVVVPSGNHGEGEVTSPGRAPYAITVGSVAGAADGVTVPDWSGRGRVSRSQQPDLLAPGVSVVSLRAEGSTADVEHPDARVSDDHFLGSGTSMSVGLVSGAVAALLEHRQWATPDDVKGALVDTTRPVDGARAGLVDIAAADAAPPRDDWHQRHPIGSGRPPGLRGNQMPWADRDAPSPETTWQRIRWMDDEWQRIRWMDGEWQRIRWMSDDEWQRIRWMDDEWQRIRWMDDEWQRIRWMEANFARIRWMDTHLTRIRWMESDWQRIRWMDDSWGDEAWTANEWDATIWADQSAP